MIPYPPGEAGELLSIVDTACRRVLGDRAIWDQEAAREDPAPLPWPPQQRGKGFPQLMRIFAMAAVDTVLQSIADANGPGRVPPADPASPDFQLVLRVVSRAVSAAEAELVQRFGGTGRMSLKRGLAKWAAECEVDRIRRAGGGAVEGFKAAGLSKSAAYRADKRARERARGK
ncbi:MAG: hypothetical protein KF683_00860 [Rubrivivax sp.]|nr:hypothetical protein [Rubrivivax sp.]